MFNHNHMKFACYVREHTSEQRLTYDVVRRFVIINSSVGF